MNGERLSLRQAAKMLERSTRWVSYMMQHELVDFGYAYSPEVMGKKTWTYDIFKNRVEEYIRGHKCETS